ncbi:EF-hand domain [Dillenia turbinata]|uniref:EF-hand domain n=1 Tax=Dillenia turbinata TaxID=194707 RepID=A0AAN8UZ10_9MAGN
MAKHEQPQSGSEPGDETETGSDSSAEELESPRPSNGDNNQKISEYEKQRLERIKENRARLEAFGIPNLSSLLFKTSATKQQDKRKGKVKVVDEGDDDDDYKPHADEEKGSSSCSEKSDSEYSASLLRKVKKGKAKPKKTVASQKLAGNAEFVDEDEAVMQAIALSLKDSNEVLDMAPGEASKKSDGNVADERKLNNESGKRRRKRPATSRVQMTEDDIILHFFEIGESVEGSITLRDLRRVAKDHDFTWTEKELADMIHCFDDDGDGKLSLDDFRKIVSRCNMLPPSEGTL